jgi:hypothetical protein
MQSRAEFRRLLQFCEVPVALLANDIVWLTHVMLFFFLCGSSEQILVAADFCQA